MAVVSLERWTVSDGGRTKELWPSRCSVNQVSVSSLEQYVDGSSFHAEVGEGVVFLLCYCFDDMWVV